MPKAIFRWGGGDKDKPETHVPWAETPAAPVGDAWSAKIPALAAGEQLVAYAMAEDESGRRILSDTVEVPEYPVWRGVERGKE